MKEEKGSEVFPNRVRLRAATIRGGESFTIPEHNFATRVFGDTSTSEDLHRWSSHHQQRSLLRFSWTSAERASLLETRCAD